MMVGAGLEAVPGIQRARSMGLHVVVSDGSARAPGFALADDALEVSTYDAEGTVAAALRYTREVRPIDGVMCLACDVPVTVARVAAALGLPGISVESAMLATDKLAMKERFARDGVPIPWFSPLASAAELEALTCEVGAGQLVIKPVDSRGGRGVLRMLEGISAQWAFEHALAHSPSGRVMVERYLDGPQVSTESIVLGGVAHTPGFSDRNYELLDRYAPHIIEDGGQLPSRLPRAVQDEVCELVGRAARSLGLDGWVAKGDVVVHRGVPHIIEMAARPSGGYFCTHEIPLNTGVDFVGSVIRLALGDPVTARELLPRFKRAVVQRYIFPKPGRVVAIRGAEEVAGWEGIELCEVRARVGDRVDAMTAHPARAGVVIAMGESVEDARQRAVRAVSHIEIETAEA